MIGAPVVLASAPVEQGVTRPAATNDSDDATTPKAGHAPAPVATQRPAPSAGDMMHIASYQRPAAEPHAAPVKPLAPRSAATKGVKFASADALAPLPKVKPAAKASVPGSAAAVKKTKESGSPK